MVRRLLLAAALVALVAGSASAETADEVIAKYIKAEGGLDKIRSIETIRMTGKSEMGQGIEMPLTRLSKRPNRIRTEFTLQGMTGIQAFDGTNAWALMPFMGKTTPEIMPADESKRTEEQADIDGPLVDYQKKGNKVELAGKEQVDGADAWKLKVTLKNGDERDYYLDAETGLPVKVTGKVTVRGSETEFTTMLGDYKDVGGRMVPFTIETGAVGMPMKQKLVLDKVEFNTPIADSLFAVPANAVHAPADSSAQASSGEGAKAAPAADSSMAKTAKKPAAKKSPKSKG